MIGSGYAAVWRRVTRGQGGHRLKSRRPSRREFIATAGIAGILAAGRQFRDQGTGGVIISTSSIYGEQAAELAFTYSAAKAAVISFTRSAAYELAEYGVRAVAITPGRVGTPIINQFSDELKATFASEQLRGTMTAPEEIADVVAFLATLRD